LMPAALGIFIPIACHIPACFAPICRGGSRLSKHVECFSGHAHNASKHMHVATVGWSKHF
jgi:hypothetical protein